MRRSFAFRTRRCKRVGSLPRRGGDRDGGADEALRRRDGRRRPHVLRPRRGGHGFLGPNGAGKTTTLRMILALARPTAGHATVKGRPYRELEQPARTVGANLEIAGAHPGRKGRDHLRALAAMAPLPRSRVDEVLRLVELEGAADRRAGKYSLGMRQRLGLAATLLGDPEVLILDEPANGLDPQGIRWLRDFLREHGRRGPHGAGLQPRAGRGGPDGRRRRRDPPRPAGRAGPGLAADRRRPRGRPLAARRTSCGRRSSRAGLQVTVDGDDARGRRRRPRPRRRARLRGRACRCTSYHARHLARGGVPGAHARRGAAGVIPLVHGEMIKVRTTRTALGFGDRVGAARARRRADHDPRRRSRHGRRRRRTRSTSAARSASRCCCSASSAPPASTAIGRSRPPS